MVITIARMYGAGALGIGRRVAESLNFPLVDPQLPVVVATRLGIAPAAAEQVVSGPKPLVERILGGLAASAPEAGTSEDIDSAVWREVDAAIVEAARGAAVILGRGAGLILSGRPDVLRVFLHAPADWRADRIARLLGCSAKEAASEVQRVDGSRRAYVRDRFGVDWRDAALYGLTLDTSVLGIDAGAETIVRAARQLS